MEKRKKNRGIQEKKENLHSHRTGLHGGAGVLLHVFGENAEVGVGELVQEREIFDVVIDRRFDNGVFSDRDKSRVWDPRRAGFVVVVGTAARVLGFVFLKWATVGRCFPAVVEPSALRGRRCVSVAGEESGCDRRLLIAGKRRGSGDRTVLSDCSDYHGKSFGG